MVSLSPTTLRLISTIGMGILVGTSLIVIIPEGVETLYTSTEIARRSMLTERNVVQWANPEVQRLDKRVPWTVGTAVRRATVNSAIQERRRAQAGPIIPGLEDQPQVAQLYPIAPRTTSDSAPVPDAETADSPKEAEPGQLQPGHAESGHSDHTDEPSSGHTPMTHGGHEGRSPHAWVGFSLVLGFILMYLIDEVPKHTKPPNSNLPYHISLDNLAQGLHRVYSTDDLRAASNDGIYTPQTPDSPVFQTSHTSSTTTGLVIHAAADGIALGASSSSTNTGLSFIIFIAIMVHKAPAAFGLTSVLLKQGLTKREARSHLIIFSIAAPVGALATWMVVNILGTARMGGDEGTKWWTGVLLLFSAGTFL
jgi:solute carrier family 39 (zinc transporter), member 9